LAAQLVDAPRLAAIRTLAGHDSPTRLAAFSRIDATRPTAIIADTIKGHGLPSSGHPQNHSALLSQEEYEELARQHGHDPTAPWARDDDGSAEARLIDDPAGRLRRPEFAPALAPSIELDLGRAHRGTSSTRAALGRVLMNLRRQSPETARRDVTVSPDVSSTTNLGGWVNKVGVWSAAQAPNWFSDDRETILHWNESEHGQHMELGIAETNLVGLLGELGAAWSRWG